MNLPIQLQAGLYLYLICINMITIAVYGIDKRNAVHGKWRIRVSTLLTLAAVGGSAGALLAMHLFHHKTRKKKFTIGVPLMLLVQIALFFFLVKADLNLRKKGDENGNEPSSPSAAMQTHSLAACKMRWRAVLSCRVRKNSIFMKCF